VTEAIAAARLQRRSRLVAGGVLASSRTCVLGIVIDRP
jgi:hypothetical protein